MTKSPTIGGGSARSPITKAPVAVGKANTITWQVAVVVAPPSSLIVVVIVNAPVVEYVWLPLTVYGARPGPPLIVPEEVVASPQLMVALKSACVPNGLSSVKVAVGPEKDWVLAGAAAHDDCRAASTTLAVETTAA